MNQRKIYLALALPGCGKTHKFLTTIQKLINSGKKVVYSLPTKALANEVIGRIPSEIKVTRIDSDTKASTNTTRALNDALAPTSDISFIMCQHATLHTCSTAHLKYWILVIDETPEILDTYSYTFTKSQFEKINYIEVSNNRIRIKKGMQTSLLDDIKEYRSAISEAHTTNASTVSKQVHDIYSALAEGCEVFYGLGKTGETEANSNHNTQAEKTRTVRIIRENDFFSRFSAAGEIHLLTATVVSGLFDHYVKLNGYAYATSIFTPETRTSFPPIRIFPMLLKPTTFSKSIALAENDSQPGTNNLKAMIGLVLEKLDQDRCLLFAHEWGQTNNDPRVVVCPFDSRGIDTLKQHRNAMVFIHGNPPAPELRSLEYLAEKHNTSLSELRYAWKVTKKYEYTLQNVFRTGLRITHNPCKSKFETDKEICLFVQDYETAEYLKTQHLPTAVVDESLATNYRIGKPRGRRQHPKKTVMIQMIMARCTNEEIEKETGLSRKTICQERKLLGIPARPKMQAALTADNKQPM